jgi:branched-chain amino acid transport system permease protein
LFDTVLTASTATLAVINMLLAWSLWFPMTARVLSMAPPAVAAIGAFLGGYMAIHVTSNLAVGLAAGVAAGALCGIPLALLAMRAEGFALATITLMIVLIVEVMAGNLKITGGAVGMIAIPTSPDVLRVGVGVCAVVVLFSWAVFRRRMGRVLDAVGYDDQMAGAVGLSSVPAKWFTLIVSGAVAGAAGVLLGRYTGYVDGTQFEFALLTQLFAYAVLGGLGSFWGPIVGAGLLTFGLQLLSGIGMWRQIVYGAVIIVVMLVARDGIVRRSSALRRRRIAPVLRSYRQA